MSFLLMIKLWRQGAGETKFPDPITQYKIVKAHCPDIK